MASQGFGVLMTADQSLRHQQNLKTTGIALIVLVATSNRLADLAPLIPLAQEILDTISPGEVEVIEIRA